MASRLIDIGCTQAEQNQTNKRIINANWTSRWASSLQSLRSKRTHRFGADFGCCRLVPKQLGVESMFRTEGRAVAGQTRQKVGPQPVTPNPLIFLKQWSCSNLLRYILLNPTLQLYSKTKTSQLIELFNSITTLLWNMRPMWLRFKFIYDEVILLR